jgi:hypothetical protein
MTITHDDIDHRVTYHAPSPVAVRLHGDLREQVADLAHYVLDAVPECPERDEGLRVLTDVVLAQWNAAVARNHDALPDE